MSAFKGVVYLSEEQFSELKTNGILTVGEETIIYDENTVYVTPEEPPDKTLSKRGKAADAEAVGEKILELQTQKGNKLYRQIFTLTDNGVNYNGAVITSKSAKYTKEDFESLAMANSFSTEFTGVMLYTATLDAIYMILQVVVTYTDRVIDKVGFKVIKLSDNTTSYIYFSTAELPFVVYEI